MKKNGSILKTEFIFKLVLVTSFLFFGCNKKNDTDDNTQTENSTMDLVTTATNVVTEGADGMDVNPSSSNFNDNLSTSGVTITTTCSSLATPSCESNTKTIDFGGCTRTNSKGVTVTLYGTSNLSFSDSGCGMSTPSNSVSRTFSGHYATVGSVGGKVLVYTGTDTIDGITISTTDLNDYTGTSRSGGTTLTNTDGTNYSLAINGVHRKRIRATGATGFWHTIYTSSPLTITKSGATKTIFGSVNVAHNVLQVTATTSFSNVTYDSSANCCYPTGGSVTYQQGDTSSTFTFSSTCGEVSIDGAAATTLPACGGVSQ